MGNTGDTLKIKQNEINNKRFYTIKCERNTFNYPSVTSITNIYAEKMFDKWQKRVGSDVVEKEKEIATTRGRRVHEMLENWLKFKLLPSQDSQDIHLFNYFLPVCERLSNILKIEECLVSHELKVAGTVDCVGYFDNVLSVVDFKTSKKKKYKSNCKHYFMQCAAYAVCFNEMFNVKIENLVLIIGVDQEKVKSYVLTSKLSEHISDFRLYRNLFKNRYGY